MGLGATSLGDILGSAVGAPGGFALKSNVSPEVDIDAATLTGALGGGTSPTPPAPVSSGSSITDRVGGFVQPTLQTIMPDGSRVTVWAPYGESTQDYRVYVAGVLVVGGLSLAGALAFAYWLGSRKGRRSRR
jgi:hypothetical protein